MENRITQMSPVQIPKPQNCGIFKSLSVVPFIAQKYMTETAYFPKFYMEISIYKRSKPFSSNERGWWWMGNRSSLPATLPPQNLLRGLRKHLKLSLQGSNWGFSGGSEGKDSACNAEDLGSIPGLERSPGEENGYPLQYS